METRRNLEEIAAGMILKAIANADIRDAIEDAERFHLGLNVSVTVNADSYDKLVEYIGSVDKGACDRLVKEYNDIKQWKESVANEMKESMSGDEYAEWCNTARIATIAEYGTVSDFHEASWKKIADEIARMGLNAKIEISKVRIQDK